MAAAFHSRYSRWALMGLDRTARVQSALSLNVGGVGFFGGPVRAKVMDFAADSDGRKPSTPVALQVCADKPGGFLCGLCAPEILLINAPGYIPQIIKRVIAGVSINVVNLMLRPSTGNVQPRKPVGQKPASCNGNYGPSVDVTSAGNASRVGGPASTLAPCEYAGLGVVMKKFAQKLRGKIGLSHDAVLSLIGQRPVSVASTAPASLF